MLSKITAKVKRGIKHGKYGDTGLDTLDEGWLRFLKPQYRPKALQEFNKTKQQTLNEKMSNEITKQLEDGANKKQRRKGRENEIMQTQTPSGTSLFLYRST